MEQATYYHHLPVSIGLEFVDEQLVATYYRMVEARRSNGTTTLQSFSSMFERKAEGTKEQGRVDEGQIGQAVQACQQA